MESEVIQIPSHQVTKMGQMVILSCDPIFGHSFFYWYQQILEQRLEFLVSFYNGKTLEKSEILKDRFSVEKPDKSYFTLKIHLTKLEDSAMYLCASSLTTALQTHLQPVHKHSCVSLSLSYQPKRRKSACVYCCSCPQIDEYLKLNYQVRYVWQECLKAMGCTDFLPKMLQSVTLGCKH
ncbi:Hypothetical predicted protein [Marmota monax]|nr:hypothetical protein GHT09_000244 [Marmota monax]VTJ59503.1 Hypothetical predicted protein [Marmota monax]